MTKAAIGFLYVLSCLVLGTAIGHRLAKLEAAAMDAAGQAGSEDASQTEDDD